MNCSLMQGIVEDELKQEKRVHESKKTERSWKNEAIGLRKEWEKERKEKVMLMKDVRKLEGEIKALATEVDRQNRLRDGLTTKKLVLQQELTHMKAQVDKGTKELKTEKQKVYSLQGKLEELERALKKSQRKIQEQTEEINEWQQKENEIKAKQSMQRDIRARIEFEEMVRAEITAKKRRVFD